MKTKTFFQSIKKHPVSTIAIVLFYCLWTFMMVNDVLGMREAPNSYEYCRSLCYLVDNGCKLVFITIYIIAGAMIYSNRQYSKWFMRLFYVIGVACLIYYFASGFLIDHVANILESEYAHKLPSLARIIFTSPISVIILCFFLIPRVVKDAMKLKEEQELTV